MLLPTSDTRLGLYFLAPQSRLLLLLLLLLLRAVGAAVRLMDLTVCRRPVAAAFAVLVQEVVAASVRPLPRTSFVRSPVVVGLD